MGGVRFPPLLKTQKQTIMSNTKFIIRNTKETIDESSKSLKDFSNLFLDKDIEELSAIELKQLFKLEYDIVLNYLLDD
jgi:hypothetical protein